jgi:acylaminoacyl-peptidase
MIVDDILDNIECKVETFPGLPDYVEGIYCKPRNVEKPPLILFPHGGPHSAHTIGYSWAVAGLCELGMSVVMINFPGSTGYGHKPLNSLLSKIGDLEIQTCHDIGKQMSNRAGKIGIFGGSHGGFIGAWMVGKYPQDYACAVLRNPVTDVGGMAASTDIPDWCFIESGFKYDAFNPKPVSIEEYKSMFEKSPASVVDQVRCPVMVLIGQDDARVPPSQGIRWVSL